MSSGGERPSHARFGVIGFGVALAVITYLDRVCISQALPFIRKDLGLTIEQTGYALSAFSLAYAFFEVPTGWWGDRVGPRRVLTRVVLWWSFFTAATGWAWNLASLVVCRFLFGAGEAGAFPNLSKAFRLWLTTREREWAQGVLWMSARWGGAFAPPLVLLTMHFVSWRWTFAVFAGLGVIWAALFFPWFRDDPRKHPGANDAERALLPDPSEAQVGHEPTPWRLLLTSPQVFWLCAQYFCQGIFFYFVVNWTPTYLQEARHLTPAKSAVWAGLPFFLGGVGCLLGGVLLRFLGPRLGPRFTRKLLAIAAFLLAAASVALVPRMPSGEWAVLAIGLAIFGNDLSMATCWNACTELGGKYAGTIGGQMNMWGNIGGFLSPLLISQILARSGGNWDLTFYVSAGVYLAGAVCWLFLDPVTPLAAPRATAAPP